MLPFFYILRIALLPLIIPCLTRLISGGLTLGVSSSENELNRLTYSKNNKHNHKITFNSKTTIFPCLDNLELYFSNFSEPVIDYQHLIRIYRANNNLNASFESKKIFISKLNQLIRYPKDDLTYVREFIINSHLINSKISIYCNLFDPAHFFYCFQYVAINKKTGKIKIESHLYCLPTLKENEYKQDKDIESDIESSVKKLNLSYHLAKNYGPSLQLFDEKQFDVINKKMIIHVNKSNKKFGDQSKQIICNCGKRVILNKTSHLVNLIQLKSANEYCSKSQIDLSNLEAFIEIEKLDFEFCLIDLIIPTWVEIQVKDSFSLSKKERDFKQYSKSFISNENLIIRDGKTYIAPQINYFNSFPTFHYISSGFLRFETKNFGNQYTIQLNYLSSKIDQLNGRADHYSEMHERSDKHKLNKLEFKKNNKFLNDRKIKLINIEKIFKGSTNQSDFKHQINQMSNIRHMEIEPHNIKLQNTTQENLLVLFINQNSQKLFVGNKKNFENFTLILSGYNKSNVIDYKILDNNIDSELIYEIEMKKFVFNLIALIVFLLIFVSFIIFTLILTKTKIKSSSGNLIKFGLSSNENIFAHNNYQEVQLSNRPNLSRKLSKVDEEAIYETCKIKDTSKENSSESENDLLNDIQNEDIESKSVENEQNYFSKQKSNEIFNANTIKNKSTFFNSLFKDEFGELDQERKIFKNLSDNCESKDNVSNNAIGRLSRCSFPTSEISLELDYYDYLTPFVPNTSSQT